MLGTTRYCGIRPLTVHLLDATAQRGIEQENQDDQDGHQQPDDVHGSDKLPRLDGIRPSEASLFQVLHGRIKFF